jgi:RHS repeat-associated protein
MKPSKLLSLLAALLLAGASASAQEIEYYSLDALGSIRVVTDRTGKVIERHDYLPFGEECTTGPCTTNPAVGAGQPRKFTGKERDTETGLDYFGARYYGSRIGRFTTVDPVYTWQENLVDPQRWNRYGYGRSNPLRYVDPDGRAAIEIPQATLARNAAIRGAVAEFLGMGTPNQHPHARFGGAVVDVLLSVFLPQNASEYRANAEATLLGLAAPMEVGTTALTRYNAEFAARQILGQAPITAGGRTITPHAAERMVQGAPGRRAMTMAEVDQVLDQGDRIRKVSMTHPEGPTVTVQNTKMPGKPQVAVDAETGKRVVTVIQPK